MKKTAGNFPLCAILFFLSCFSVFAAGKTEEAEVLPLNNEWILCLTQFDSSALPEDKRTVGDVFMRSLMGAVQTVDYRIRVSPEYAYYEDYAWSQARTAAAKTLAAKQDERALLLYRGEAGWRYRQNLKKVNAEIALLRETFSETAATKPLINNEPDFQLLASNIAGTFPARPESGGEYRFCQAQKCDAFLSGTIEDFYGRYYVTLTLYVVYTDSFVYEGDVVFSAEDVESAANEIAGRLTAILAGSKPAAIAVTAKPDNALILINQSFAGRGNVEAKELPPGTKTVAVSLEGHVPETVEAELKGGELAEISMTLGPQLYGDVNITVPGKTGVSVYRGAMYVGEAPLTVRLPLNQLDYINVNTRDGEEAKAVYFTPMTPDEAYTLSLKTRVSFPPGEKRVNKARGWYYWAWGGTWLTGITAWLVNGIYTSQNDALMRSSSFNEKFYNDTLVMSYINTGAIVAVSVAVAYEIFQMMRYLYTATDKATPIVKTEIAK